MRTTRLLGLSLSTMAALTALGAIGGCGMDSRITVVGANPRSVAVNTSNRSTDTSTSSARTATTAQAVEPAAAAASISSIFTASSAPTTSTGEPCSAAALHLQVFESSLPSPSTHPDASPNAKSTSANSVRTSPTNNLDSRNSTRTQQLTLVFTNVSRSACTLRGYPSVDFLRAGVRGPLSAPDSFVPTPGVATVRISPGGAASSLITITTNSSGNHHGSRCEAVIAVRVYPPGSTKALTSATRTSSTSAALPHFYVCGHKVVVRAVQPE